MRYLVPILTLALLAGPSFAQAPAAPPPADQAPAAPAPLVAPNPAPAVPAPAVPAKPPRPVKPRLTFAQRFDAANTTHDGRLTLDQARAAHMYALSRRFDAIDADHKGYVTSQDIVAYRKAMKGKAPAL
jgi:hypothetical protein